MLILVRNFPYPFWSFLQQLFRIIPRDPQGISEEIPPATLLWNSFFFRKFKINTTSNSLTNNPEISLVVPIVLLWIYTYIFWIIPSEMFSRTRQALDIGFSPRISLDIVPPISSTLSSRLFFRNSFGPFHAKEGILRHIFFQSCFQRFTLKFARHFLLGLFVWVIP